MTWTHTLTLLLQLAGAGQMLLALAHFAFPKPLNWHEETGRMSALNRQIFWVHTLFVALTVFLLGALSLFYAQALLTPSPLARPVLAGFTLFWAVRFYCQFFVYRSDLWRGKRFETGIHIFFAFLWAGLALLYGTAFFFASAR